MATSGDTLDSSGKEMRRLMDFQQGDILCIPEGDAKIAEVRAEGNLVTLVYIQRERQKAFTAVCTKEYVARKRGV